MYRIPWLPLCVIGSACSPCDPPPVRMGSAPFGIPNDLRTEDPYDVDAGLAEVLVAAPAHSFDPEAPTPEIEVEIPIRGAHVINEGDCWDFDGLVCFDTYLEDAHLAVMYDGDPVTFRGMRGWKGDTLDFVVTRIANSQGHVRITGVRDVEVVDEDGPIRVLPYERGLRWEEIGSVNVHVWGVIGGPVEPCPRELDGCDDLRTPGGPDLVVGNMGPEGQCYDVLAPLWHFESLDAAFDLVTQIGDAELFAQRFVR